MKDRDKLTIQALLGKPWTWRDELGYRWYVFRRRQLGPWLHAANGLAFWALTLLALLWSPWLWWAAGASWVLFLVMRLRGTRDLFTELLTAALKPLPAGQHQAGGDRSTNVQAGRDVMTAERGQWWADLPSAREPMSEQERKERADHAALMAKLAAQRAAQRRHPAGGPDQP